MKRYNPTTRPRRRKVKRYAELIGNYKIYWIKSQQDNILVCDEDYAGEYIVSLYNDSNQPQIIEPGDRIAQLVFLPYLDIGFEVVDELEKTQRGAGGFGSTGLK